MGAICQWAFMTCAGIALSAAPYATAGTPGATVSLGKSKGIEYSQAKFRSVVTQVTQPATCDGDAEVTGGGGSMAGPAATSALNESYPMPENAWHAEGSSTGGAKTLTAFAICGPVDAEYASSQTAAPENGAVIHGYAGCGPNLMGGGGGASGGGIRLIASVAGGPLTSPGWTPAVVNPTMDDTLFDSYAICAPYDIKLREAQTKLKAGEDGKVTAKCKPSEVVLGGGFQGRKGEVIGFRTLAMASKPWDSADNRKTPDDGWQVRASNAEPSLNVELVAVAVCRD
jgi:hypothetical protein